MKKRLKYLIAVLLIIPLLLIASHLIFLKSVASAGIFPKDQFLDTVRHKKAVIITAHDDDAFVFSGTIHKLVEQGWEVRQISFKRKDEGKNQLFYNVASKQGLKTVDLIPKIYMDGLTESTAPYKPFPIDSFPKVFHMDSMYAILNTLLVKYDPSVIFSLDDVIGGYGHPEHVMISKLVVKYLEENKGRNNCHLQRIYQGVLPHVMAEKIFIKYTRTSSVDNPYPIGKIAYKCNGMPPPDCYVDIYKWAAKKKKYMNGFSAHDRHNINKVAMFYNWYPSWIYFRIFNKEYFRIVE